MESVSFRALQSAQNDAGMFESRVVTRKTDDLPPGELLIKVRYSSLNYKDALSASGNRGVTRQYPHTPGIDAVGDVVVSSDSQFAVGASVIVTGFDLGMNCAGGLAEYIRVPSRWAVPLPDGLSYFESMALGTAGLTAALCIDKLVQLGMTPTQGDVLVTGATGGVGSCAIAMLSQLGYSVIASTGKAINHDFLKRIGATRLIERETLAQESVKSLGPVSWANAVDTVGGSTLENVLKSLQYGGSVANCGLVSSPNIHTSVYPFILRNVNLLGIDSVELPMPARTLMWKKLATVYKPSVLLEMVNTIGLEQTPEFLTRFLQGRITGRVVVRISP